MKQTWLITVILCAMAVGCSVPASTHRAREHASKDSVGVVEAQSANWPQFRGPNASGVAPDRGLPVEFSPTNNLLWKTTVPSGNSSPCIWEDSIFLTGFKDSRRLVVLCVGRSNGQIRWEREVPAERIEKVHPRVGSPASSTPATDGQRVYAFFGSVGVGCFDFQGRLLWKHELGPFTYHLGWGAASSPIVCGNAVILNCDHDGDSFLVALDKKTGEVKWRTARPSSPPSYSTPILWELVGETQLLIAGSGQITAYAADTGDSVWHVALSEAFVATTPVIGHGLLFATAVDRNSVTGDFSASARARRSPNWDALFANHDGNRDSKISPQEVPQMSPQTFERIDADRDGFLTRQELQSDLVRQQSEPGPPQQQRQSGNVLVAIRPRGRGDVTETHIAWRVPRVADYVPSPLCYGNYVYVVKGGGMVSCVEAATGKLAWQERIGAIGGYYASPVAGDAKIYLVNESGEVTVLTAGPKPQVLQRNSLRERCFATPAIAGQRLYVRTESSLLCFGNDIDGLRGK